MYTYSVSGYDINNKVIKVALMRTQPTQSDNSYLWWNKGSAVDELTVRLPSHVVVFSSSTLTCW